MYSDDFNTPIYDNGTPKSVTNTLKTFDQKKATIAH